MTLLDISFFNFICGRILKIIQQFVKLEAKYSGTFFQARCTSEFILLMITSMLTYILQNLQILHNYQINVANSFCLIQSRIQASYLLLPVVADW